MSTCPRTGSFVVITFASLAIAVSLFLWTPFYSGLPPPAWTQTSTGDSAQIVKLAPSYAPRGWNFDPARDANNYSLNSAQCARAFPRLYHELERAVRQRHELALGNVTTEDVDVQWRDSGELVRVLLWEGQLRIVDTNWADHGWDIPRALAILHSIHRAVLSSRAERIPNIEFAVSVGDWPGDPIDEHPIWVLTRHRDQPNKWVMPDFGFWSWPIDFIGEYTQVRRDIEENEPAWDNKDTRLVWRGATKTNALREALVRVSKGKAWSDVQEIKWNDEELMKQTALSIPEHCNYRFVAHTEGHSYSGRGKYLLNCHSVSVVHEPEWIEPHTHLFIPSGPQQNVVAVRRDFKDLNKQMKSLMRQPERAQQIATNSVATFRDRYLTPAATACYWRDMFRAWASVSFEPQLFEIVEGERRERGVSFESWVTELEYPEEDADD
ncbi:hypothetical protein EJ06DRAFT_556497 [Trichodelitschia bisporula]|uniref:Glycosyl transferase CAP10 domain-containing protein n=1 Tax=Trichodelitschia bisporula TaxID=703511 RepID=A0A6G1HYY3_9PEZI|nr:hypothetical protein EJ06DRAFT_556497 [Trichodelitschia bisporula]